MIKLMFNNMSQNPHVGSTRDIPSPCEAENEHGLSSSVAQKQDWEVWVSERHEGDKEVWTSRRRNKGSFYKGCWNRTSGGHQSCGASLHWEMPTINPRWKSWHHTATGNRSYKRKLVSWRIHGHQVWTKVVPMGHQQKVCGNSWELCSRFMCWILSQWRALQASCSCDLHKCFLKSTTSTLLVPNQLWNHWAQAPSYPSRWICFFKEQWWDQMCNNMNEKHLLESTPLWTALIWESRSYCHHLTFNVMNGWLNKEQLRHHLTFLETYNQIRDQEQNWRQKQCCALCNLSRADCDGLAMYLPSGLVIVSLITTGCIFLVVSAGGALNLMSSDFFHRCQVPCMQISFLTRWAGFVFCCFFAVFLWKVRNFWGEVSLFPRKEFRMSCNCCKANWESMRWFRISYLGVAHCTSAPPLSARGLGNCQMLTS